MTPLDRQALLALLAAQLEDARAQQGLKRYALAAQRMSRNTVTRILSGKDHRLSTLVELADALGCDVVIEIKRRIA